MKAFFIKLVLLLIFVGLIVLGFIGYNWVTNTPEYSIRNLLLSVKKCDYAEFQQYVDVDSVMVSLFNENTVNPVASLQQGDSLSETLGKSMAWLIGPQMIETMRTQAKNRLQSEITSCNLSKELMKTAPEKDFDKSLTNFLIWKNHDPFYLSIQSQGTVATAVLEKKLPNNAPSSKLSLNLKKIDQRWKVVQMEVPKSLLQPQR
jgi:hypothetical protein